MVDLLEKIPVKIYSDESTALSEKVAAEIAEVIQKNNAENKHTVMILDTGTIILEAYHELVSMFKDNKLDFSKTITFGMYEYYEIPNGHPFSIQKFLEDGFVSKVNIKKENAHFLDGTVPKDKLEEHLKKFDEEIKNLGGADILIIGLGDDGHVAFSSPSTPIDSKTRLVQLDTWTLVSSIPDFSEIKFIPKYGLTMGFSSMINAKKVIFAATGDLKAEIVKSIVENPITDKLAVTHFQKNPNASIFIDEAAAIKLSRIVSPWLVCDVDWKDKTSRARAVCNLSEFLHKKIPELQTRDFLQYSLRNLIQQYPVEPLIKEIMDYIQSKIISSDKLPKGKDIVVFSPHPDDDIISMGGTLMKLVENGNKVTCIYITPGTNAVFDHEVEKFMFNRKNFAEKTGNKELLEKEKEYCDKILNFLKEKSQSKYGLKDTDDVKFIKRIIRQGEGASACSFAKVNNYEFLDPPLYKSGRSKKNPLTQEDIDIIWDVLNRYKPSIVYAAGDLTDPNGTHRLCLRAILKAFEKYSKENRPELWLYRGAWQEFHPVDADFFLIMNEEELQLKRDGIYRHQSQKDRPPQPGHSGKEFWQSSEERNLNTAKLLTSYGFPKLYAAEGLKRYY